MGSSLSDTLGFRFLNANGRYGNRERSILRRDPAEDRDVDHPSARSVIRPRSDCRRAAGEGDVLIGVPGQHVCESAGGFWVPGGSGETLENMLKLTYGND